MSMNREYMSKLFKKGNGTVTGSAITGYPNEEGISITKYDTFEDLRDCRTLWL